MAAGRQAAAGRRRDRGAREQVILAAARDVLVRDGFQGFGINAIARQAGCDKQLIYRYFGGLDGLVAAIATDLSATIGAALAPLVALGPPRTHADAVERVVLGYLHMLRGDPLLQRIAAWELAEPSPLAQRLTSARTEALSAWLVRMRGSLAAPECVDAVAVNAVLIAAIQQLVLASGASGQSAGVALQQEADWDRMRAILKTAIAGVYRTPV